MKKIVGLLMIAITILFLIAILKPAPQDQLETPEMKEELREDVEPSKLEDFDLNKIISVIPKDAIPAITNPEFTEEDYLEEDDYIIGVNINGDVRAYPVIILDWHEIVNDEVGGVPIAVTYCPLCSSGVVYDRRVNNRVLTFKVSGKLYKNDLVMYDVETESLWPQILGKAVLGELSGFELKYIPSDYVTWKTWKTLYPKTKLMAIPNYVKTYGFYPYGDYRTSEGTLFPVENRDDSMHPKTLVLGVRIGGSEKAYPLDVLSRERVINDNLGDKNIVVVYYDGYARAFLRDELEFSLLEDFYMRDGSGRKWNMVTGEGDGTLEPVYSAISFWFAWYDLYPDTEVFGV